MYILYICHDITRVTEQKESLSIHDLAVQLKIRNEFTQYSLFDNNYGLKLRVNLHTAVKLLVGNILIRSFSI